LIILIIAPLGSRLEQGGKKKMLRGLKDIVVLASKKESGRVSIREIVCAGIYGHSGYAGEVMKSLCMMGLFRAGLCAFYLNREEAGKRGLL
jgi:hypothetical protein